MDLDTLRERYIDKYVGTIPPRSKESRPPVRAAFLDRGRRHQGSTSPRLPALPPPLLALREPTRRRFLVDGTGPGHAARSPPPTTRYSGSNNVINLSVHDLSSDELDELLGLSLSFVPSPHPRHFSRQHLQVDFDTLCQTHMSRYTCGIPLATERTLGSICSHIQEQLGNVRLRHTEPNLPPHLDKALSHLRHNQQIVVFKADKGDAIVITGVDHYTNLAWDHLSDGNTYSLLSEDPTPTIVSTFNTYLRRCREHRVIDAWTHDRLKLPQTPLSKPHQVVTDRLLFGRPHRKGLQVS